MGGVVGYSCQNSYPCCGKYYDEGVCQYVFYHSGYGCCHYCISQVVDCSQEYSCGQVCSNDVCQNGCFSGVGVF
jgi:hypothetical protein